jgi:hypothetical protein
MSNASLIYESLRNYADIKGLLGRQEDIFLDFKTRSAKWNKPGFLSDDERRLYSKAASGFAHQEGGVLICADDTEDEQRIADWMQAHDTQMLFTAVARLVQSAQGLSEFRHAYDPTSTQRQTCLAANLNLFCTPHQSL